MILNPGTQHFDFDGTKNPPHPVIVLMSLEPSPGSLVADLSNNPAVDTVGD